MSELVCGDANYLVLHFMNGKLISTKVTRSWRGAMMSKRNHERPYQKLVAEFPRAREAYDCATRIIPISAVLAIKGLEKPDTELSEEDIALLKKMGIA